MGAPIRLGRAYGSTERERALALPGDHIVADAEVVTDHAITIDAPPSAVWPWLVQMGWGRGGWYTARWVDRLLFPANGPSADRIIPELQDIDVGTFIPDGPPRTECGLDVEQIERERALVLHSNSHLPMSWRDRATLVPADFIMSRDMLRGVKRRAERTAAEPTCLERSGQLTAARSAS